MISKLQQPIINFFNSTNENNPEEFIRAFKEDAFVLDAGREFKGIKEIKEWSKTDFFDVKLTLEPINLIEDENETIVIAKADGNFDKTGLPNPLILDFHFIINDNKIDDLKIIFIANR